MKLRPVRNVGKDARVVLNIMANKPAPKNADARSFALLVKMGVPKARAQRVLGSSS